MTEKSILSWIDKHPKCLIIRDTDDYAVYYRWLLPTRGATLAEAITKMEEQIQAEPFVRM